MFLSKLSYFTSEMLSDALRQSVKIPDRTWAHVFSNEGLTHEAQLAEAVRAFIADALAETSSDRVPDCIRDNCLGQLQVFTRGDVSVFGASLPELVSQVSSAISGIETPRGDADSKEFVTNCAQAVD